MTSHYNIRTTKIIRVALILIVSMAASLSAANDIPEGLFRYVTKEGRTVLTNTLPIEAIYTGYDIVDTRGRILKSVEPALPEEERKARQAELQAEAEQRKRDEELLRLYPTAEDAERAKKRQLDTIDISRNYAKNGLKQLQEKLADTLSSAADMEKQGKQVPVHISQQVEVYEKQIKEQQAKIDAIQDDVDAVNKEFDPIIERLIAIHSAKEES